MSKNNSQEYRGNGEHEWEEVVVGETFNTLRLRVPGGWLYADMGSDGGVSAGGAYSMCFVPMPEVVKHKV